MDAECSKASWRFRGQRDSRIHLYSYSALLCKANMQNLPICIISRYCILALHGIHWRGNLYSAIISLIVRTHVVSICPL